MGKINKNLKYHYFYKITNLLNNHFYYGIHSTNNLEDGYMGSGTRLNYAYKKYGIENFEKEILKFFDTREECSNYEAEMVTEELIRNDDCYNVIMGGDTFNYTNNVTVKDSNNNYFTVSVFDERYVNGELKPMHCGEIQVRLKGSEDGFYYISTDEYYKNKEMYETKNTNKMLVKDKKNNTYLVPKDDERLKNGELINFWIDRKHNEDTKQKMKETHKLNKHQQGEKNSQYGTCWVMKDNINKKIKKDELEHYLELGWTKGRKMK